MYRSSLVLFEVRASCRRAGTVSSPRYTLKAAFKGVDRFSKGERCDTTTTQA